MDRKKNGIPSYSLAWMPRDRQLEVRAEVLPCTAGATLLTVDPQQLDLVSEGYNFPHHTGLQQSPPHQHYGL